MLTGTAPGRRRCLRVRVAAQKQPVCPPEMSSDLFPLNSKASFFVELTTLFVFSNAEHLGAVRWLRSFSQSVWV